MHELEYLPAISGLSAIAVPYFHQIGRESDRRLGADHSIPSDGYCPTQIFPFGRAAHAPQRAGTTCAGSGGMSSGCVPTPRAAAANPGASRTGLIGAWTWGQPWLMTFVTLKSGLTALHRQRAGPSPSCYDPC
jgi:hypothetical protein